MTVPYSFGSATAAIPLSQLDSNFNTPITIGNTAVTLGNTVTTLNNMTLNNVTVTGSTINGVTFTNSTSNNSTLNSVTINSGTITGTVSNSTISNSTVANAVSDSVNITGFMGLPQNAQNGAYGVVLADAGKHIYHPAGQAAATYTIPANSNVAFTTGTAITIINGSANNVTVAITTDTMYLSSNGATGSRTLAQYGVATAVKVTSTSWIISGSNLT